MQRESRPRVSHTARKPGSEPSEGARTLWNAVDVVNQYTGLKDGERALVALEVTISALFLRLPADDAEAIAKQLPSVLRDRLAAFPPGPDDTIDFAWVRDELARRLDVDPKQAEGVAFEAARAVQDLLKSGEICDPHAHLVGPMRAIFEQSARN